MIIYKIYEHYNFCAVACFLSVLAKDLPTTLYLRDAKFEVRCSESLT